MKIKIKHNERPFWRAWDEKWLTVHTNRCFCSARYCRRAKKEKNYVNGWTICVGKNVVLIDRRRPKGCPSMY